MELIFLGDFIRCRREDLGLTQRQLCEGICEPMTISRIERGERTPRHNTVIAKGITFTGVIEGDGIVQIEGRLEGEVRLKGSVTVTTTGEVQGPITADSVRVAGEVTGSITAREHLCLERTGSIHGDVSTCSLVVENGRLDGSSKMLMPQERPQEPQPAEVTVSSLDFDIPLDEG